MDLLLLGAGMGIVGGLLPSPLHLIALTQVVLDKWIRALLVLVAAPLIIEGALLVATLLFYQYIPLNIAHYMAYVGGAVLLFFAISSLIKMRGKTHEELAESKSFTYSSVTV